MQWIVYDAPRNRALRFEDRTLPGGVPVEVSNEYADRVLAKDLGGAAGTVRLVESEIESELEAAEGEEHDAE